ncbi:MAG: HAD hydrolase-like protein [Ignisphaera sp.]
MGVEAIVFDVDGTLALLPVDWGVVMNAIRRESCHANSFLGFVNKCHGTESFWRIHNFVSELELRAVENLIVLDNSPSIVSELCKSYVLGFVTMQGRVAGMQVLRRLGISDCAKTFVSREDARNRIEQIAVAVKALSVSPSRALFIGDKVLDALAAYLNGLKAIVILRNARDFRISDTDYLDEDLEVLGIPIAKSLLDAIEIASTLGWVSIASVNKGLSNSR